MKIFKFPIISRTQDLVLEHILMSVMGFIGSYALLFFGNGKGGRAAAETAIYFLEHTFLKFSICLAAVIICNVYVIIKNSKKDQLIGLNYLEKEGKLQFTLISQYSSRSLLKSIPVQDIRLTRTPKNNFFFSTKDKSEFAYIKPKENLWIYQRAEIYQGLKTLQEKLGISVISQYNTNIYRQESLM